MGPSPKPFGDRSETVPRPPLYRRRSRGRLRTVRKPNSCTAPICCILPSPSSQRVLRLPRNRYLTLQKCCACHAIQTLRNLRAAVPMGPSPNPFRTRSETVPRPFRDRLRTGVAAEVVCALSGSPIHAQRQRFLHLAIPQLAACHAISF